MRLIDADALKDDFDALAYEDWNQGIPISLADAYKKAANMVENMPTVEPQTGEWRFSPDDAEGICTVCQYKIYGRPYQGRYLIVPYNFCPNCGARMVTE